MVEIIGKNYHKLSNMTYDALISTTPTVTSKYDFSAGNQALIDDFSAGNQVLIEWIN